MHLTPPRFNIFHSEKLPSAQSRYVAEVNRVVRVLDRVLADRNWLVGDKCTYADLAFVIWNSQIEFIMQEKIEFTMQGNGWDAGRYPNFKAWQERMCARESVKKVLGVIMEREVRSEGGGD